MNLFPLGRAGSLSLSLETRDVRLAESLIRWNYDVICHVSCDVVDLQQRRGKPEKKSNFLPAPHILFLYGMVLVSTSM